MRYTDVDIYFNGRRLSDLGAVITDPPSFEIAPRDLEFKAMPGASGDTVVDNKKYKNISKTYKVTSLPTLGADDEQGFTFRLTEWLQPDPSAGQSIDYLQLRKSWLKGYFRKAICTEISEAKIECSGVVSASITLNIAPHLYSDVGTYPLTFTASNGEVDVTVRNPEKWASLPVIRIVGSGDFSCIVGSQAMICQNVDTAIVIDASESEVYDASGNLYNSHISTLKMPSLLPGDNRIRITGSGLTRVELTPNWRRL